MKNPTQIIESIRKRVATGWHLDIVAGSANWPQQFSLGSPTQAELEDDFDTFQDLAFDWRDWGTAEAITVSSTPRRVHGSIQSIPDHIVVPDLDTAVRLIGGEWPARLIRGRERYSLLRSRFPGDLDLASIVRAIDTYSDTDFELLCGTARWFSRNSEAALDLTPRQVPIEGLHTKWLAAHRSQVLVLAGLETLGLKDPHPRRVHFTYLDPDYLAAGNRQHDSVTVGDTMFPPYLPEVVIISENKDTAVHFPELQDAISVEGGGFEGAKAIAAIDWIAEATQLIYWGDMDAAGLEIVNQFRAAGLAITTILMDQRTFTSYEKFGATTDARGVALTRSVRKILPYLTRAEQELYENLTDPEWTRVVRVEQERIPLQRALEAIRAVS